jgi:hypothetical protein
MNEIYILIFLLGLTTFFVWLHYYKKFQLDSYRQDIFKIRDDLFVYAAEGNIPFNHEAYKMVRGYLNGSIRFAERFSLLRIVIMKIEFKEHKPHFQKVFDSKLKGLSQEQIFKINSALDKVVNRTLLYIGDKNITLICLFHISNYLRVFKSNLTKLKSKLRMEYFNTYSDAVYNEGLLNRA